MLVRAQSRAGKQRRGVDEIVEIVDDDRAMLLEAGVPRRGRAGELAGVGDDVFLGALGAAGAQDQHRFAIDYRAVEGGGEAFRLFGRRFEIAGDDVDLGTFGLVAKIVGGVEHDFVAAAGAEVKSQTALDAKVHQ